MQIFAVTRRWPGTTQDALTAAVQHAAHAFPRLDPRTTMAIGDQALGLYAAAISHPEAVSAPRRYRALRDATTVLFDGLPVDRRGEFAGYDAAQLLERWSDLPARLEGVFSAVRIDVRSGRVECLLDVLGMAQVYVLEGRAGWAFSNSVEVLRLLAGDPPLDPLGVSSLLTLGWPAGGRTMLSGVRLLPGGHLHRFDTRAAAADAILTPRSVAPRAVGPPGSAGDLAAAMARSTHAAADGIEPLLLGLTAGRDSRVILALALAAGLRVQLFTSGHEDDLDVRIGRDLAARVRLPHRVIVPDLPDDADDWAAQTSRFVSQTDGLASLWGVADWVEHQRPVERLGLKLWGAGGEIGRSGRIGIGIPFMANVPGLRRSWRAQLWVLEQKTDAFGGLITPLAVDETLRYLRRYLAERREEGWRSSEVLESYYAFERVRHWAAAGVRRAAEGVDVFAPFICRDYIAYSYGLTPGRRYVEAAHHGLLSALSPELRDLPFDHPWKPQRPRAATAHVALETARWAVARARAPHRGAAAARQPFPSAWVEAGLPLHRELSLSMGDSPLWDLVDRSRWEALLALPPPDRAPHAEAISRLLTVFWYFHGRHMLGSLPVAPAQPRDHVTS
ncbi:MAG: hypothetical protein M3296_10800 [Actinomycetota bacterium]|nr:hypothetical protein [Actinomycetota bacterium]